MERKDCAYCIDLDEQGALCDHPLRLYCGEPVEARCSSRCTDYEQRMSITEALSRIHDLEAKLAESEKHRAGYADMLIPLKVENEKLKALIRDMWWTMVKAAWDDEQPSLTEIRERIDDAGVEVYE